MQARHEEAAAAIAASIVRLGREAPVELRPLDLSEVSADQRRFAASVSRALAPRGFRVLADVEPVHLAAHVARRTLLRLHVDATATVTAAAYSLEPQPPASRVLSLLLSPARRRARTRTVELETAWADGSVLVTNNAGAIAQFRTSPRIDIEVLPAASSPGTLVLRHASRVARYAAVNPGVEMLRVPDVDTAARLATRQAELKNEFRRSIGHLDEDELRALLGRHHDLLADRVRHHVRLLAAQDDA